VRPGKARATTTRPIRRWAKNGTGLLLEEVLDPKARRATHWALLDRQLGADAPFDPVAARSAESPGFEFEIERCTEGLRKGGFEFCRRMLSPAIGSEINTSTLVRPRLHGLAASWCQNWCQATSPGEQWAEGLRDGLMTQFVRTQTPSPSMTYGFLSSRTQGPPSCVDVIQQNVARVTTVIDAAPGGCSGSSCSLRTLARLVMDRDAI
jgi:hypothetical protein